MFEGVFCPSITIIDDSWNIDYESWGKHLDHLADAGINGVLLFGSIGEFFAVPFEEKKKAIKFAKERIGDKTKLFFGIGDTILDNVIELAKYAQELEIDAVVAVSPYYFGPTDMAATKYYSAIAEFVNIPIILYNFPDRTGSDLNPELVASLVSKYKNIVGIKDTVDTISHTRKVLYAARKINPDFCVLSGFDEYYFVNRISGGNGVLSGLTNIEPEIFVKMHKAYQSNDYDTALDCAKRISHLMAVYDVCDLFISSIKAAVKVKGLDICTNIFEPGSQVTNEQLNLIQEIIESN